MTTRTLDLPSTLNEAGKLIRAGRLADAIAISEAALARGSDPVLHALVGTVALRTGDNDRAARHLTSALTTRPDDVTVRVNLIEALVALGRLDEAFDLADEGRSFADGSLRLARLRGFLAQERQDFEAAVAALRHVAARDPNDWASLNNLGNALNALDRQDEAIAALKRAAELAPNSAPILLNLAQAYIDSGEGASAESVLMDMTRRFPSDDKPWTNLYNLYKLAGEEDAAFASLERAVELAPADARLAGDLGQELAYRNLYKRAELMFEKAISLDPKLFGAYQGLGGLLERLNREDELDPLLARARSNGASESEIGFIEALKCKRENRFEEALAALDASADTVIPARKAHLRGQLLDRLGRYDEAWAAFSEMNHFWETSPINALDRARVYRAQAAATRAIMSREWAASWTQVDLPLDRPTPVFLVGFPRSGTTLLDTILMGHPMVQVLEEEPFIADIEEAWGGPEAFAQLTPEQVAEARATYFRRAGEVEALRAGTLIVDKQPLHLNKVAAIRRLFPDARFVLALRHPLDVLLSCLVTNFRPNHAMANFLRPDLAAELYDLTFSTWEKSRSVFDPPVHTIIYEEMVEDPAAQLKPLVEWLGLDWRDELLDHRKTASRRDHISTASYAQVVEPIYTRSKGRWQRYATHLEPIFPVIRPWAEKYGYAI